MKLFEPHSLFLFYTSKYFKHFLSGFACTNCTTVMTSNPIITAKYIARYSGANCSTWIISSFAISNPVWKKTSAHSDTKKDNAQMPFITSQRYHSKNALGERIPVNTAGKSIPPKPTKTALFRFIESNLQSTFGIGKR